MAPGGLRGTIRHCSCLSAGRAGRFLDSRRFAIYATCDSLTHVRAGDAAIPRRPKQRRARPAVLVQYGALPYRFTPMAALEILIVTTRQSRRWIVPKGWPIKRLTPSKSAAREAFEEAGVRGKIGARSIGNFRYKKTADENGAEADCEVKVFPLLVTRQSAAWPNTGSAWFSGSIRRRRLRLSESRS